MIFMNIPFVFLLKIFHADHLYRGFNPDFA
jgi:hypothetical protein